MSGPFAQHENELKEVLQERGSNYGSWETQGAVARELKAPARSLPDNGLLPAERESIDMILHKISRLLCGDAAQQDDTWRDIAGYAEIARKLRESGNGGS